MKKIILIIFAVCIVSTSIYYLKQQYSRINIVTIPLKNFSMVLETLAQKNDNKINIKQRVNGQNVYVECYIPHFTFTKNNNNFGYLKLYVDNKEIDTIHTAAFIIKGLAKGEHVIRIQGMNNNKALQNSIEVFPVSIP